MPILEVVAGAVARAIGEPERAARLRADSPLDGLGIDSLALLCVADLLEDAGWCLPEATAREAVTIGDLAAGAVPAGNDA